METVSIVKPLPLSRPYHGPKRAIMMPGALLSPLGGFGLKALRAGDKANYILPKRKASALISGTSHGACIGTYRHRPLLVVFGIDFSV